MDINNTTRFDGADYVHERDHSRLKCQMLRVFSLMKDGCWRTLREIAYSTGDPEASVSAQLRHLRKERFGSYQVDRMRGKNGLYYYRLLPGENDG